MLAADPNRIRDHLWISGLTRGARATALSQLPRPHQKIDVWTSCHRVTGGPVAGVTTVLKALVPVAIRHTPDLVERHRDQILYLVPELADLTGPATPTLVSTTRHEERTRYFGNGYLRGMSQGVVTFLINYARLGRADRSSPLILLFDDAQAADRTEQELLAILLRRANPADLRVIISSTAPAGPAPSQVTGDPLVDLRADTLVDELTNALNGYAARLIAQDLQPSNEIRTQTELVRAYITADGRSDDPAEYGAYAACSADRRAEMHDTRADELSRDPDRRQLLGAIPYHRERGTDPAGAGRAALREALEICVAVGFSTATIEIGLRGRAVTDPDRHQQDYCHFTAKAASACIPAGLTDQAELLYQELRDRYTSPRVQMTSCYALAMLHTRFFVPRDHEKALELMELAREFARQEPDPVESVYFQVYQDNGLALVEMHRGNLERALGLLNEGMRRIERDVPEDRFIVHRTQLMHNRARLLTAMGRVDEAFAEFTRLIALDPAHVEYHVDRADLSRRRGDLGAALADYDRAVQVSAPFPAVFHNRAGLRAELGDLPGAVQDLRYAVEMEPTFVEAVVALVSTLLEDIGDPDAAYDVLMNVRDHLVGHPTPGYLLGQVEEARSDPAAAWAAYGLALTEDPDFTPALVARATLAHAGGDHESAVTDLTRAVSLLTDPGDVAAALFNLGVVHAAAGWPDRYAEDLDRLDRLGAQELAAELRATVVRAGAA
jgi:tetratricopeptide (TPR) repeat protein